MEAELFSSLAKLADRQDATAQALGHQLGEHGQALLTAQEDSVALKRMIETLASGSGPAAAPAGQADPWWVGRNGPHQPPHDGDGGNGGNGDPYGNRGFGPGGGGFPTGGGSGPGPSGGGPRGGGGKHK